MLSVSGFETVWLLMSVRNNLRTLERVGVISEDPKPPRWTHVSSPAEH